jgi:hypothetical protein
MSSGQQSWPTLYALLGACLTLGGCDAHDLRVVEATGVFRSDAGCVLAEEGGGACPTRAQFPFETSEPGFVSRSPRLISNLRVTCHRSFCGTGALAYHASLHWRDNSEQNPDKLAEVRYLFATPVDMLGQELSYEVAVDPFNTPMNALVAVVSRGRFHKVDDGPLLGRDGWKTKGGVVGPQNQYWEGADNVTSVPVSEIWIQVYLSIPARAPGGTWQGEIYLDEVGWR